MKNIRNPFRAEYRVTSPFGSRTLNGKKTYHAGIDLVCDTDSTVIATDNGKVITSRIVTDKSNKTWEWGNYICIQTDEGKRLYYCHLKERAVKTGDYVKTGAGIGVMGNTGYSFGAHLHFEVRQNNVPVNAAEYLGIKNQSGKAVSLNEGEKMTAEEKKAFEQLKKRVESLEKDNQSLGQMFLQHSFPKYTGIDKTMPEWAHEDIQWLKDKNFLRGSAGGRLDLSHDMLRILVIMSRAMQSLYLDAFE